MSNEQLLNQRSFPVAPKSRFVMPEKDSAYYSPGKRTQPITHQAAEILFPGSDIAFF